MAQLIEPDGSGPPMNRNSPTSDQLQKSTLEAALRLVFFGTAKLIF